MTPEASVGAPVVVEVVEEEVAVVEVVVDEEEREEMKGDSTSGEKGPDASKRLRGVNWRLWMGVDLVKRALTRPPGGSDWRREVEASRNRESVSHNRMDWSPDPDARRFPSAE